jgi:hypothetical protein
VAVQQRTYLLPELGGTPMYNALEATVDLDFERGVSQATIVFTEELDEWEHDMDVNVIMGAGTNNISRFSGVLWEPSWTLRPGRWSITCRGKLSRLETLRQTLRPGQLAEDLTGTTTPTLGEYAQGLLDASGLDYDPGNISDDPSILLATVDPHPLMWKHNFTLRQQFDELQKVSVGRRLFESVGGELYFFQIIGRPRNVADLEFTQGVDIFASTDSVRTIREAKNYISISGYAKDAIEANRITFEDWAPNDFQPEGVYYPAEPVQSEWVQTTAHAEALFDYWAQELSRELVRINYSTFRDDPIGPGQTHALLFPGVHVTEPAWCRGVSISVRGGKFRQYVRGLAGGLPQDYEAPPSI